MTVRDLALALPSIGELRDRCRALAALDAVMSPEWESRYHSFYPQWAPGEQRAAMRNGSGDEYAIQFSAAGCCARGFDHESPMSPWADEDGAPWPGVLDDVPAAFRAFVEEPALGDEEGRRDVTVCLWREPADTGWRHGHIDFPPGADPDGSGYVFGILAAGAPEAYRTFVAEYWEREVDVAAVRYVYELRPLTAEVVAALNPAVTVADVAEDLGLIGYPVRP